MTISLFTPQKVARNIIAALVILTAVLALSQSARAGPFKHAFNEIRQYHQHWLRVCPMDGDRLCRAVTYTRTSGDGFFLEGRLSIERTAAGYAMRFLDEGVAGIEARGKAISYTFVFSNGEQVTAQLSSNNVVSERETTDQSTINTLLPLMKAANWVRIAAIGSGGQGQTYSLLGLSAALDAMGKPAEKQANRPKPEPSVHRAETWPGEYPRGFTVSQTHERKLFVEPSKTSQQTVPCAFTRGATYHVWNTARVTAEDVKFVAFQPITQWRTNANVEVIEAKAGNNQPFILPAGARWTSLQYLAEGHHILEYDGVRYFGENNLFENSVQTDGPTDPITALWLGKRCESGRTGWLPMDALVDDLRVTGPNIIEYGKADDL
ncbi:MAG: hypothetical protein AAGM04_12590 [Pseudomonadota bacterium]